MSALRPTMIVLCSAAVCSVASANSVVNGGFETGDFTGWNTMAAGAGSDFSVDAFAHTGTFSARFGADMGQHDEISQVVDTIDGLAYTIEFWVHNLGVGEDSLQVHWEGANVFDSAPVGSELESWVFFSIDVTATSNGSDLRFAGFDAISTFYIDDICVNEVPTPGAAALIALGGLVVARRRRA